MPTTRTPRIRIDDLPAQRPLSEEEMARILGAGRFRPGFEQLEDRRVMSASAVSNLGNVPVQFNLRDDGHLLMTRAHVQTDVGSGIQGLYQGHDSEGHQVAFELVKHSLSEFTPDRGWVNVAAPGQAAQDHSGDVYFAEGSDLFRATGVPTTASAGRQTVDHAAQGLYQAKDSAGNPAAYVLRSGCVYQISGNSLRPVSGTDVRQVAVDGHGVLFALSVNGIAYRYPGSGSRWDPVSSNDLRQLAVDGRGVLFGLSVSGTAYRYPGSGGRWDPVSGSDLTQLAVDGRGELYGLCVNGVAYHYPGSGGTWTPVSGNDLRQLAVDGRGQLYGLSANGTAYHYPGQGGVWQPVSGSDLRQLAVDGRGELFGLSVNGIAYHYPGSGSVWQPVSGSDLRQLAVDGRGELFGLSVSGAVFHYPGSGGVWQRVSGYDVWQLAVDGRGTLFGLGVNGVAYRYPGQGVVWQPVSGNDLGQLVVDGRGQLYGLSVNHTAYRYPGSGSRWDAVSGSDLTQLAVDGRGVLFGLSVGGTAYCYPGSGGRWDPVSGNDLSQLVVDGRGQLFGLSVNRTLYHYPGQGSRWQPVSGNDLSQVTTDGHGELYGLSVNHTAYHYPGSGGAWTPVSGNDLRELAVDGRGVLYGLSVGGTVYRYPGRGGVWAAVDYLAQSIASDVTGNLRISYSPIGQKWRALGGSNSFLGMPTSGEQDVPGGRGAHFRGGDIYWSSATGAHEVHGAILQHWLSVGGPASPFGLPTSDEGAWTEMGDPVGLTFVNLPVNRGRVSQFQHGSIRFDQTGISVQLDLDGYDPQGSDPNGCGPNSGARVMRYYGYPAHMAGLKSQFNEMDPVLSSVGLGVPGADLASIMRDAGYKAATYENPSFDNILAHLAAGHPVVAMIRVGTIEMDYQDKWGGLGTGNGIGGETGKVLDYLGNVVGHAADVVVQKVAFPQLHWIALDGYDPAKQLIFYTDTDGRHYQVSYAAFKAEWNWTSGNALVSQALKARGVVSGSIVY